MTPDKRWLKYLAPPLSKNGVDHQTTVIEYGPKQEQCFSVKIVKILHKQVQVKVLFSNNKK